MMERMFVKYSINIVILTVILTWAQLIGLLKSENLGDCIGCSMLAYLVWKLPLSLTAHTRTTIVK